MKKTILGGFAAVAMVAATTVSPAPAKAAPEFSCSTAKLIVPWGAGGGTSVIFNIFENIVNNELNAEPKIQVVTIPGQGGNKGAKEAKDSKPDGCTLFAVHQSALVSYLNGRVDFNHTAFDMVANLTHTPEIFGGSGANPWKTMAELKEHALKNPETITAGATFGSTSQFMYLLLEENTGMKFKYVPFDGTAQRMTALLANTIDLGGINLAAARKHVDAGTLKAYAFAGEERSKHLPDLPTLKELGIDMTYSLDRGILAPKGTPKDMVDHWSQVFKKAAEHPKLIEQLDAKGTLVKWQGPEDYAKWFDAQYEAHEKVAIKIGMYRK